MSEQYFQATPGSAHRPQALRVDYGGVEFTFMTDAGVFSRDGLDEGTRVLLDATVPHLTGRVLDLGCGWGPAGVIAGRLCHGCAVTMSDINERACGLAKDNAARNWVRAEVHCADGLGGFEGIYDWILLNPPIRAGKETVYGLFRESAGRLAPEGRLAVVIRKQQGAPSAKVTLESLFHTVSLARRNKGYHVFICEGVRE